MAPAKKDVLQRLLCLPAFSCTSAFGQLPAASHALLGESLNTVVKGQLLSAQENRIQLLDSDSLILQVNTMEIKSFQEITSGCGGTPCFRDAWSNRLILMPRGFGLRERAFHITNMEIVGL